MGTVRFSDSLKQDILSNARDMFSAEKEKAHASFSSGWGDRLYDSMFSAQVQAQMKACPDWCFETKTGLQLRGFTNAPKDVWQTGETTVDTWKSESEIQLAFALPRRWPAKYDNAKTNFKQDWRNALIDYQDTRYDWLKPEWKKYTQAIFNAQVKQDEFIAGVQRIMDSYSTLAPALKAWQPLWDLVPNEAKDRHKKIVERPKTKEAEELGIDLNSMTAAVTFNKLTRK